MVLLANFCQFNTEEQVTLVTSDGRYQQLLATGISNIDDIRCGWNNQASMVVVTWWYTSGWNSSPFSLAHDNK